MTWTTRPRSKLGDLTAITGGDGPPVVLIHGVGLRAEAWSGQIEALIKDFRVIAIDLPGHGESETLSRQQSLKDYVTFIGDVLSEPALIVGHSMGAMIALALAVRFPDRVSGICAMNAIYRRDQKAAAAVQARAAMLDGQSVADPSSTLDRWFGTETSVERSACERWLREVDPAGYRAAYAAFAQADAPEDEALRALRMPALFMTGALEPNSTPEMSHAMAALVPRGRAEVVAGAAHMMPMTHVEAVNRQLRVFAEEALA